MANRILEAGQILTQNSGFDGVFIDVMGSAPVESNAYSGKPINPTTSPKRQFTRAEWLSATSSLAGKIKGNLSSKLVFSNGLQSGEEFFDPLGQTKVLLNTQDGAMAENFMRVSTTSLSSFRSETEWKKTLIC